ncbi:DnaJ domain-containing protein [Hymenobacter sp. NST-14]|uniref:J domain-containing protein n=1 Tax=Hymenobacter piscis TaxID=2839984 RepID=UPI001C024F6F|nr:J domain-containing protein [Hymenobacter piscis]MBT9392275.1 DnaJ domain-containing protein [Hymenobacter piscis]
MTQNHYQVLGLSATASAQDIRLAYRRLAVQYHPDKHGGNTLYEELFKAVAAAYHVLGHESRRAHYDQQLRQAARRAEEVRRQQEYRHQGQRVYGVPMPAPAPLRTRRPAGAHERHYRPIPRQQVKFTRRDYWLTALLGLGLLLFIFSVKMTMDHVSGVRNYERGLRAYVRHDWVAAHSYFTDALHFKPDYYPARRRRAEVSQLGLREYDTARPDLRAALADAPRTEQGELWLRLGQCEAALRRPRAAQAAYARATALDSTLARAWLLRAEAALFGRRQFGKADRQLTRGLRHAPAGSRLRGQLLTYRGLARFKQQHYEAAQQDYWEVLDITPRSGQLYFLLGRVAQQQQDPARACEYFGRAIVQGYGFAQAARDTTCIKR